MVSAKMRMHQMKSRVFQPNAMAFQGKRILRPLATGVFAAVLSLALLTTLWGAEAHAARPAMATFDALETCAAAADCRQPQTSAERAGLWNWRTAAMSDVQPSIAVPQLSSHVEHPEGNGESSEVVVWSAVLTVGKSAISSIGYLGYVSGGGPETGSIDESAFTHWGVDYAVTALYHPIVAGDPNHLFLHLDKPLLGEMTLSVGDDVFAISDASVLGAKRNVYHWYLDAGLGWAAGQEIPVALTAPPPPDGGQLWLVKQLAPAGG